MPLRKRLVGLLRGHPTVSLLGYNCFGQCDHGPNVLFMPDEEWYGGLKQADSAERVVAHATTGAPMDRAPLRVPSGERQLHLRNVRELIEALTPPTAEARGPWWAFWRR